MQLKPRSALALPICLGEERGQRKEGAAQGLCHLCGMFQVDFSHRSCTWKLPSAKVQERSNALVLLWFTFTQKPIKTTGYFPTLKLKVSARFVLAKKVYSLSCSSWSAALHSTCKGHCPRSKQQYRVLGVLQAINLCLER